MKTNLIKKDQEVFEEMKQQIGRNIKRIRESQNKTQADFDCEPYPIDLKNWQRLEYGKANFTLQTLFIVCKKLGVEAGEVLGQGF